jgi:hypothetical protein
MGDMAESINVTFSVAIGKAGKSHSGKARKEQKV